MSGFDYNCAAPAPYDFIRLKLIMMLMTQPPAFSSRIRERETRISLNGASVSGSETKISLIYSIHSLNKSDLFRVIFKVHPLLSFFFKNSNTYKSCNLTGWQVTMPPKVLSYLRKGQVTPNGCYMYYTKSRRNAKSLGGVSLRAATRSKLSM